MDGAPADCRRSALTMPPRAHAGGQGPRYASCKGQTSTRRAAGAYRELRQESLSVASARRWWTCVTCRTTMRPCASSAILDLRRREDGGNRHLGPGLDRVSVLECRMRGRSFIRSLMCVERVVSFDFPRAIPWVDLPTFTQGGVDAAVSVHLSGRERTVGPRPPLLKRNST